MNLQTDLFSSGPELVHSLPPYLDPARASLVLVDLEEDGDHVAPAVAGVLPIGAVGNNAAVWVVRVFDREEKILHANSFASRKAANGYADGIREKLEGNRQRDLFAAEPAAVEGPERGAEGLPLFAN